ncbi:MAG: NADH-quinone oxidoreductase subunit J [Mycobacteriaceae bacterium]
MSATLLAQAPSLLAQAGDTVSTGEAVTFWILGPLALFGAVALVLARSAVHSALFLVLTMLSLGVLYMVQQAPFLGFVQIIVYTGAVMMLFLFVLMLVGRDSSDSVVEVLRGQRLAAAVLGLGFAGIVVASLARALTSVPSVGLQAVNGTGGGNVGQVGALLFTQYLFPFELTSALLITAALGAMVLAYTGAGGGQKVSQRERVVARLQGTRISPLPGPGVFATTDSVATPALLPDGSIAPGSLSELLDATISSRLTRDLAQVRGEGQQRGPHSLTGAGAETDA